MSQESGLDTAVDDGADGPPYVDESVYQRGFYTSAKVGLSLTVAAAVANLSLITCLWACRKLRKQYLYLQV